MIASKNLGDHLNELYPEVEKLEEAKPNFSISKSLVMVRLYCLHGVVTKQTHLGGDPFLCDQQVRGSI